MRGVSPNASPCPPCHSERSRDISAAGRLRPRRIFMRCLHALTLGRHDRERETFGRHDKERNRKIHRAADCFDCIGNTDSTGCNELHGHVALGHKAANTQTHKQESPPDVFRKGILFFLIRSITSSLLELLEHRLQELLELRSAAD